MTDQWRVVVEFGEWSKPSVYVSDPRSRAKAVALMRRIARYGLEDGDMVIAVGSVCRVSVRTHEDIEAVLRRNTAVVPSPEQ